MINEFATLTYSQNKKQVCWQGWNLSGNAAFGSFMRTNVAERLNDEPGKRAFEDDLRGLALTGFGIENLKAVLDSSSAEERDWAVGEALAEAWLTDEHEVVWPWNMERDKRNSKASLPGADLVGFMQSGGETRLVLGEVKTSGERKFPPQVMSGRSGHMGHQLDTLACNLGTVSQLLKWLFYRCRNTDFATLYREALTHYFNSGNKAVSLFGILIRDTEVNELDLQKRGLALGESLDSPTTCHLLALYLPCSIAGLPECVKGGDAV